MPFKGKTVVKRFFIAGDGRVKGVGFRPRLVSEGFDHRLKVAVRNIPGMEKVEVVVEGLEEDVEAFWRLVKEVNLRVVKGNVYTVTELEDYTGPPVDWAYGVTVLTLEQAAKGIPILSSIDDRLGSLERGLSSIEKAVRELPLKIAEELKKSRF